nr:U5 small nuclear ribonucleoprotein helicase [Tanacetum cinerariifolium]
MAVVNNRVNEKHNSVLDDSGTTSNRVNEGIGSPSTMVSNNEPSFVVNSELMDSLDGKHNVESVVNPNLGRYESKIGFRALVTPAGNGADVVVSKESVCVMNEQLNNTVYGFFLVKRAAYLVVEKYVKTAWSKFSLVKSIMTKGVFFFKFSSKDGMKSMLENERQMMDEKLMLVDGDEKPLNKVDFDPVNANSDSDSDIEVTYNETPQFMAGGGANDASLYEEEDYDIYDTYDIEGLTKQDLAFCDRY